MYSVMKIIPVMQQLNIFENSNKRKENINFEHINNGEYLYLRNFFSKPKSDFLFTELRNNVIWKQESMNMYGRVINFPRLTAWYGDNDKPYSFSGITLQPLGWTEILIEIKKRLESVAKTNFNSVLLNLYRNGNDSISWHTDAEKELGKNPIIASVNFGATRKFQMRHRTTKEKIEINLEHGSLLIMRGELQHFWQHQVPKTKKKVEERINLTFREIK